jgi:hypothetical protein
MCLCPSSREALRLLLPAVLMGILAQSCIAQEPAPELDGYTVINAIGGVFSPKVISSTSGHGPPSFGEDARAKPSREIHYRALESVAGKPVLLITADEIDLGEWADYVFVGDERAPANRPTKVVIVAQIVRISRPIVVFGQGTPRGADVAIICHHAILDAPLEVNTGFSDGTKPSQGGDVLFAADSIEVRGRTTDPVDLLTARTGKALRVYQVGDYATGGGKGRLLVSNIADQSVQDYRQELSEWKLQMLEYLQYKIHDARRRSSYSEITDLVRKYQSLPDWPTSERFRPALSSLLSQVESVVNSMKVLSWQLQVPGGMGSVRTLMLFREAPNWQTQIAPTDMLLRTRDKNGRSVVGIIRKDSSSPDRVQILLEADLVASPAAIAQAIDNTPEGVSGMFNDWELVSPKIAALGLQSYSAQVVGRVVQIQLTLDAETGTVALWQLGQEPGVPISFEYACNKDPGTKGELPLFISLVKRSKTDVSIVGDQLTNNGKTEVALQYVLVNNSVVNLNPAVIVPPKTTVKLVLPDLQAATASNVSISLPSDGILYTGRDPFSLADFDTADTASLIQQVSVENLLPAFDERLGMGLDYVEVTIIYVLGAQRQQAIAGPYRLSARGTDGSNIVVPFIKSGTSGYSFKIRGTAFYDKGRSSVKFESNPTDDPDIKIDPTVLDAGQTVH